LIDLLEPSAEPNNILRLLKVDGLVEEFAHELLPGLGVVLDGAGERFRHLSAELLITPRPPCTAQKGKLTGQSPLLEQLEKGWNQFAVGQIPARAENHQTLRRDHALLSQSNP
jgi:hypothetical protein